MEMLKTKKWYDKCYDGQNDGYGEKDQMASYGKMMTSYEGMQTKR